MKLHTGHIEVIMANYLDYRANVIVPNISWGLELHEIDLLLLTSSDYAWELEIKTSLSDLRADKRKRHGHYSDKIKRLYFVVPEELKAAALKEIPERAGLFVIITKITGKDVQHYVRLEKMAKINTKARKFNDKERQKLYELASLRIWSLKTIVNRLVDEKRRA